MPPGKEGSSMRDREQAGNFLGTAERDHRALCGMEDSAVFSAEIFGFHVRQILKKTDPQSSQ